MNAVTTLRDKRGVLAYSWRVVLVMEIEKSRDICAGV